MQLLLVVLALHLLREVVRAFTKNEDVETVDTNVPTVHHPAEYELR